MNTLDNYSKIKYAGGKYYAVYLPSHPDSLADGYVYEHRLVAAKVLGRPLTKEEYVHHKDNNGLNNAPENLMVFATNADHAAFHKGLKVYEVDGVYYAKNMLNTIKRTCVDCGKLIHYDSTRCCSCANSRRYSATPRKPPRNILKQDIMTCNFLAIGRKYGVSDNAIRKWCKSYGLPYKTTEIKKLSETERVLL